MDILKRTSRKYIEIETCFTALKDSMRRLSYKLKFQAQVAIDMERLDDKKNSEQKKFSFSNSACSCSYIIHTQTHSQPKKNTS